MKQTIKLTGVLLTLSLLMIGCTAKITTDTGTTNTAKPSNSASSSTTASSNKSGSTSKKEKPKTEIKDEKAAKPKDAKKQPNTINIPAEWVYYADEARGYGFSLPSGSSGESATGDVDSFVAVTPDDITVIVFAFKDASLSKEDLLERAEKSLNAMGETVTTGELKGESDDYAVADASSVSADSEP